MKESEYIQEELEQLAPELARLKAQGLKAPSPPEGYFDHLAGRVVAREKASGRQPLTVVWRAWTQQRLKARAIVATAAAVLLVMSVGAYIFFPSASTSSSLAELSEAEVQAYIEGNIDEFSVSLILEAELVESGDDVPAVQLIPELGEEEAEEYLYELLEEGELEELF